MLADLKFAFRQLAHAPAFAATAVFTLAIGIGAATAIFTVVDAVVLRPLPYPEPDRIVRVYQTKPDESRDNHAGPDFLDFRDQGRHVFAAAAAYREASFSMSGRTGAVQLHTVLVTPQYFEVFGTRPLHGRTFQDADRLASARPVVLEYGAWQKHFGGSETAIGRVVRLNQEQHEIVGIMPAGFAADVVPDLWAVSRKDLPETPFPDPGDLEHDRRVHYLHMLARLRPGVSIDQAGAAVATIAARLAKQYPDTNATRGARVVALHDDVVGEVRPALLLLLAAVGVVLGVVAVNIASLLLARAAARRKEIAIRAALGAKRMRLVRQALTESLVLGAIGGFVGLLLAAWGLNLLVALGPGDVPRLAGASLDGRVFAFSAALTFLVACIFGILPALNITRADLMTIMRRATVGAQRQRLRTTLVALELAASVVLLVAAMLIGRSFMKLQRVDMGYDPASVLTMGVPLPEARYRDEHRQQDFFRTLLPRINALPGIQSAAAAFPRPLSGGAGGANFRIEGRPTPNGEQNYAALAWITPGYFRTMGIPLLRGRAFTERDASTAPRVIVINRRMWQRFWPNEDPVGKRIRFSAEEKDPWWEVVGVVADARTYGVGQLPGPEFYVPHAQSALPFMSVLVRTSLDPGAAAAAIRAEVAALDPDLPAGELSPISDAYREQIAPSRFRTILLLFFGATSLLLAALGVYGVISYSVTQRTSEIGIRLALGASRAQVRSLVMREGLALAGVGLLVGLAASLIATRWLAALLYEVTPSDPVTIAGVVGTLLAVAALAAYVPTRRAMRIEPAIALRAE
jgi:putative ABC transport system permease protein